MIPMQRQCRLCVAGNSTALRWVLTLGPFSSPAILDAVGPAGQSPLWTACGTVSVEAVEALLTAGADPLHMSASGASLMQCVFAQARAFGQVLGQGRVSIFRLLVAAARARFVRVLVDGEVGVRSRGTRYWGSHVPTCQVQGAGTP